MESIIEKLQTNKLTEVFFTARAPLNTTQVSKFCEAVIINKSLIEISFTAKSLSTLNGKQWIELLTALSKNSTLKVLSFGPTALNELDSSSKEKLLDLIKSSLSLQVLNLNGNNLGDSFGVPLGAAFEKNYFITTLDLSNTKIGEPTAKSLSEVLCTKNEKLERLILSDNPAIGDQGIKHFSAMLKKKKCHLKELHLAGCNIGDSGVTTLVDGLIRNSSLKVLVLQRNDISDKGAKELAYVFEGATSIQELNLNDNPKIGDASAREFIRAVTTNSVYMKLTLNNCNIGESSLMQINKYMNFPTVEKIGQFIDKAREEEECARIAKEELSWLIPILEEKPHLNLLRHACVLFNNLTQFQSSKESLGNDVRILKSFIDLLNSDDPFCRNVAYGIIWQLSKDEKIRSKILLLKESDQVYKNMLHQVNSLEEMTKKYAKAAFHLFRRFSFNDQNFYESTSKKEIEKGSGWWLYKYQNLRVGTSFHKGICISKLNPQHREIFIMLQISTITQPPPQNKWILCLKLPIPNILISPGNKFRCILKLDLSTKWSFSFSFQGKKMDPQMTHQNGWSYMNVEIPTSQQLKQMPKIEDHFQAIIDTNDNHSLFLVLESTSFSERPSHFWVKSVQISNLKELKET